jgi:hypothetical protein
MKENLTLTIDKETKQRAKHVIPNLPCFYVLQSF